MQGENGKKDEYEVTKEEAIKLNKKPKTIAEKEEKKVEQILAELKSPSLLVDTVKEVQKHVAGEEDTIIAEIIVATTRLVKNSIPESTNLLLSDTTGIGKDYTTKKTLEVIIPEEDLLHCTKMTPESFTYWHYKDSDWTWNGKVIHFEDISQSLINCSTFKTMSSGDNFAVVVKEQKTLEIPINGKPCMILTSHHANPQDENLRRFRIGGLNDTKKQTRNILDKISQKYTGEYEIKKDYIIRSAVQSLEPYEVIIPFAEIIQYFFPDTILMRTHYHCFLDYICASAIFHQYQREKTKNGRLIATPDDYMIARMVLIYTTSNPNMIPLSKEYREIIKIIKDNGELTVHDLEIKCNHSQRWLYSHLPRIAGTKIIEKGEIFNERANKSVMTFKFVDFTANMIPTWGKLADEIYNIINKTNKTNKTKAFQQLERWFCNHRAEPTKLKNGFALVLHGCNITFNRVVLLVFTVLHGFLSDRDEKRYKKYYEEKGFDPVKPTSNSSIETFENEEQQTKNDNYISLSNKLGDQILDLKIYCEKLKSAGHEISYIALCDNFNKNFIEKCKEQKVLIALPNGNYKFNEAD
jgi:hypothetical protein